MMSPRPLTDITPYWLVKVRFLQKLGTYSERLLGLDPNPLHNARPRREMRSSFVRPRNCIPSLLRPFTLALSELSVIPHHFAGQSLDTLHAQASSPLTIIYDLLSYCTCFILHFILSHDPHHIIPSTLYSGHLQCCTTECHPSRVSVQYSIDCAR